MKTFAEFSPFSLFCLFFEDDQGSVLRVSPVEVSLGDKPTWTLRYQGYCSHCTAQIGLVFSRYLGNFRRFYTFASLVRNFLLLGTLTFKDLWRKELGKLWCIMWLRRIKKIIAEYKIWVIVLIKQNWRI